MRQLESGNFKLQTLNPKEKFGIPASAAKATSRAKKERLDRLSPGKTQKPKGTFSRAALSCDINIKPQSGFPVNKLSKKFLRNSQPTGNQ